jgi:hypothetical protein
MADTPSTFQADATTPDTPGSFVQDQAPGAFEKGSTTEAAGRGLANSSTLGVGKWVNGMVDASGIFPWSPRDPNKGFWDNVKDSVEGEKAANIAAFSAHPIAYIAGSATGGLASGGATGGLKAGAQLAALAGEGAVQGASETTTNLGDLTANAAKGASINTVVGSVGAGVSKVASKAATRYAGNLATEMNAGEAAAAENVPFWQNNAPGNPKVAPTGSWTAKEVLRVNNLEGEPSMLQKAWSAVTGGGQSVPMMPSTGIAAGDAAKKLGTTALAAAVPVVGAVGGGWTGGQIADLVGANHNTGVEIGAGLGGAGAAGFKSSLMKQGISGAADVVGANAMNYPTTTPRIMGAGTAGAGGIVTPNAIAATPGAPNSFVPQNDTRSPLKKYTDQFWSNF